MKKIIAELKQLKVKNFIFLVIAGIVNSIGVVVFLMPVKLYDSGISGTSMLLSFVTPEWFTLSLFLLILNVPLFLFGLKKQGIQFTVYAIFSVAMYSLSAFMITNVLPIEVSISSPIAGTDLLLCCLFGGIISGIGSGMAIRFGGAMDGVEVMAVIFAKKLGVTVGTFVMIYNVILYVACGIIMGNWSLSLYSIVAYMAALKTVDFIVEGIDRSKSAMIVTAKPEEICTALSEEFECGITTIQAKGYYSGSDKTVVYIVINRFQVYRMKEIIKKIDSSAFVSVSEIADVFRSETQKR